MPGPILDVQTEDLQETVLLHVHGEVDMASSPALLDAVMSAIRTQRHVIVDVRHVAYMDMSGFHALEDAKQSVDGRQGFVLAASAPHIDKIIQLIRFGDILRVFPTTEAALDFVKGHQRTDILRNNTSLRNNASRERP